MPRAADPRGRRRGSRGVGAPSLMIGPRDNVVEASEGAAGRDLKALIARQLKRR
jgi:hypothetical protein